jgi:phycocyanobilin lyase alpha subunit
MDEFTSEQFGADSSADQSAALTIEQAIANLQGDDWGQRYYAAWWLGRFRVRTPEAVEALIASLADEADRTPDGGYPLRRNAARALGKLNDCRAVPALIQCLNCSDFYVREAAAQSLGALGDRTAAAPLLNLLAGGVEAAQPIPGSPRLAQPYDAVIEALGALGAIEAIEHLQPFLAHPTAIVQYATARALYQLTGEPRYADQLVAALSGSTLQLRRSVLADLGAIGYLPAAEAIAETLAENSLKLISLKGLLEHQVQQTPGTEVSADAIRVMSLMDSLL